MIFSFFFKVLPGLMRASLMIRRGQSPEASETCKIKQKLFT